MFIFACGEQKTFFIPPPPNPAGREGGRAAAATSAALDDDDAWNKTVQKSISRMRIYVHTCGRLSGSSKLQIRPHKHPVLLFPVCEITVLTFENILNLEAER